MSQEVREQIANGDDALAPCLFVHYHDSLKPKVRELLEDRLVIVAVCNHNHSHNQKRESGEGSQT